MRASSERLLRPLLEALSLALALPDVHGVDRGPRSRRRDAVAREDPSSDPRGRSGGDVRGSPVGEQRSNATREMVVLCAAATVRLRVDAVIVEMVSKVTTYASLHEIEACLALVADFFATPEHGFRA